MSWIRSTATDYKDLSDQLVLAASSNSVQSVDSVAAGGSGYAVGDIITLTGGTFSIAAQLEVVTLSTTAVATVRIYNAGVYSVAASDPVAQGSTDGSGTSATFNLTFANNGWDVNRDTGTGISAVDSVAAGGTGYSVDDIITLDGGIYDTVATLRVATLSGSAVATVTIEDAGYYRVTPADAVVQASVAPAGGSGATFNLTWDEGEREVQLVGEGSGAETIYVGWRTLSGSGYYNFELHGFTGFNAALELDQQVGVSPGFFDQSSTFQPGAYMLCQNTSMSYWVSVTSSRIILVIKAGAAYFNAYLGYGNRFATTSEYPYPLCIAGHDSYPFDLSSQSKLSSGLTDPWASSSANASGPMFVMGPDNTWISVKNGDISTTLTAKEEVVVTPAGVPDGENNTLISVTAADRWAGSDISFVDLIPRHVSTTPTYHIEPTPGTTAYHTLLPTVVVQSDPQMALIELMEVYFMSAFLSTGSLVTEDRIIDGTDVYRIFQNCNRTDVYAFLAIKES